PETGSMFEGNLHRQSGYAWVRSPPDHDAGGAKWIAHEFIQYLTGMQANLRNVGFGRENAFGLKRNISIAGGSRDFPDPEITHIFHGRG
ncbi:hypothetical protein, partial [Paraburkholderia aspalathi]|uniref:hypothetical protein n=1 Tax=Paraburkholderia aspalathi TaxID=1324617 RepID=UPI001BA47AEB